MRIKIVKTKIWLLGTWSKSPPRVWKQTDTKVYMIIQGLGSTCILSTHPSHIPMSHKNNEPYTPHKNNEPYTPDDVKELGR